MGMYFDGPRLLDKVDTTMMEGGSQEDIIAR